ncbi:hypothetical protein ACEQ8H_001952 [Pleosporales sp. CAS-2024a]
MHDRGADRVSLQRCLDMEIRLDTPKVSPQNPSIHEYASDFSSNWPTTTHSNSENTLAQALVLGLGSMFNHSTRDQNVVWERDVSRHIITYRAWRDIQAGEELCISYGSHLTFKDVDDPAMTPPETELQQLNQIHID